MAARLPLPNRLAFVNKNYTTLQQAVINGANSVALDVLSNVTGFISAAEDDFLTPLRLIWMRRTDYNLQLDQYGTFDIRTALTQTALEVVSVYSAGGGTSLVANTYWQYAVPFDRKDLNTFRKLQGNVNIEPIYTIDGSIVRVWPPVNYYGPLACSYYADWPRLGDIDTNSVLQQQTLVITGTATTAGTLVFQTTIQPTTTVNIAIGDTVTTITNKILAANIVYEVDAGNNLTYWSAAQTAPGTIVLTSPSYISNAAFTSTLTGATGVTVTNTNTQVANIALVQTNWFMDNYPYLYYYATLKQIFLYFNDLDRAKWAGDQAAKLVFEIQAVSDRADSSDSSDGYNYNQNIQW